MVNIFVLNMNHYLASDGEVVMDLVLLVSASFVVLFDNYIEVNGQIYQSGKFCNYKNAPEGESVLVYVQSV